MISTGGTARALREAGIERVVVVGLVTDHCVKETVIDALRCVKLGLDRGLSGPLLGPSAYFMKSPPEQWTDNRARDEVEDFAQSSSE